MYGNDVTGSAALALTGVSVLAHSVLAGTIIFAGLALLTAARVLRHRAKEQE